ncbi:MAG: DNA mismatch repair protein MutS [Bacteroidaceae bacterium]|nr:DNA mismatch repair protein MutS [Bacteroidaceae bacterium]
MAVSNPSETPMMKQFFDLKSKNPDAILLFRCGDFYETYSTDAVEASEILGITLTRRSNGKNGAQPLEMAGFPHHALDVYLPKLIRAGRRVAICDQLEDPKLTKTLVKRGITELVTPGVAMNDTVLRGKENNFLAAVHFGKGSWGIAFLDISTGEFLTAEGPADHIDKLLSNFSPKETLIERGRRHLFEENFGAKYYLHEMDDWAFTETFARDKLSAHFKVRNMKGFGVEHLRSGKVAAGVILEYMVQTMHTNLSHICSIRMIEEERFVRLDRFTIRNLELVDSMNEDGVSLLKVMDHTSSPMGGRLLRRWMLFPLRDVSAVNARLDVVDYLFRDPDTCDALHDNLQQTGDLERLVSKAAVGRISPREVLSLRQALDSLVGIREACVSCNDDGLRALGERIDLCEELRDRIAREICPDAPVAVSRGGIIAGGVNEELDRLRSISHGGKDYLMKIQQREIEATGISSLKIAYNNVFGYYLEVRNTFKDKVPDTWIRKQTLVNAERYITEELKEYEETILGAEDRILSLETRLFADLCQAILPYVQTMQSDAVAVAQIDCLLSAALLARERRYIRPVVDDSLSLEIRQGRHPVIESQMAPGESYVANDVSLDTSSQQILIITGPNMAGKSALLRQTALITLMAQMGSYVPAESARIGIVDKIFTRVGASDNISAGESTFMVEMTEAAGILNNVSPRSLVLFDELGRGTSTYDGISIAWAIVEYLHEQPSARARTLFATHYHELNEMASSFSRIRNFNVSVREVDGRVVFLRKLVPGGSEHSFGIHVAEMAGMPVSIVRRASDILVQMESSGNEKSVTRPTSEIAGSREGLQMSFFQLDDPVLSQIRDDILHTDIDNLTPVEALNKLNDIRRILKGK